MEHTLEVWRDGTCVFHSDERWLHPLRALAAYLEASAVEPAALTVCDKVTGRAAALLLAGLGIRRLRTEVLSEPGREVLDRFGFDYTAATRVPAIACATERLLADTLDPAAAWTLVRQRAGWVV